MFFSCELCDDARRGRRLISKLLRRAALFHFLMEKERKQTWCDSPVSLLIAFYSLPRPSPTRVSHMYQCPFKHTHTHTHGFGMLHRVIAQLAALLSRAPFKNSQRKIPLGPNLLKRPPHHAPLIPRPSRCPRPSPLTKSISVKDGKF